MALPKQIQAQIDAVAAYEQQVADANKPADEPKPDDQTTPEDPKPEEVKNAEPVPVEPTKTQDDDNSDKWKQRYLSLQGQFNSQMSTLQQQVKTLTERLEETTEQLAKKTEQPPAEPTELVTTKDVEAFGDDLVDLARRIAREEFGKRETKYLDKIEALETQLTEAKGQVGEVAQTQHKNATEMFFDSLTRALPTWEQIQSTPECQAWLANRIPGSSATWNDALQYAAQQRDIGKVLEVFETFFEKNPALNPKAKQQQSSAKSELQRQVAPGKSSASSAQGTQKRVYNSAEYQAESNRIVRLMQQGKHDEALRIQADLDAALTEGRFNP